MSSFRDRFATLPASEKRVTLRALPQFLAKTNKTEGLYKILTDFGFIELKVEKEGVQSLIDDYELMTTFSLDSPDKKSKNLLILKNSLRLSAEIVNEDKKRLSEQLISRLITSDNPDILVLLADIRRQKTLQGKPWLRHQTPTLPQADSPLVRTLTGHKGMIQALVVNFDESRLISASWDTDIKVWDVKAGVELRTLKGHTGIVHSLQITPDDLRVVSASSDGTIRIWDIESGSQSQEIAVGSINSMALTSDGKKAISASSDRTVKVWDLESGTLINTLNGHRKSVHAVVITADDKYIISAEGRADGISAVRHNGLQQNSGFAHAVPKASAYLDGSSLNLLVNFDFGGEPNSMMSGEPNLIKVWDLEKGAEVCSLEAGYNSHTSVLAVSSDGRTLIAGSDLLLKVWKLEYEDSLKIRFVSHLKGHTRSIYGVAITRDGKKIVSSSQDSTVRIWNRDSGVEIKTFPRHDTYVNALCISANANRLITGSSDGTIKIWNFPQMPEVEPHIGHDRKVTSIKTADDGERAFSVSWDNKVKIWDMKSGQVISDIGPVGTPLSKRNLQQFGGGPLLEDLNDQFTKRGLRMEEAAYFGRQITDITGMHTPLLAVATTPNDRAIIVSVYGGLLACELLSENHGISTIINSQYKTGMHEDLIEDCCVTRDGSLIILGVSFPPKLSTSFEIVQGKIIVNTTTHKRCQEDACFLTVLDLDQGTARHLKGHKASVKAVAATLDGTKIVSGSDDTTVKVWDVDSAREIRTLSGHTMGITSVVVTSDSKCAISASRDGKIKVWDLVAGQELMTLDGHNAEINAIALAPDDKTLISVSSDKTLKVWNLKSGEAIASFREDGCLLSCAIAADGVSILVGEESGNVHSLRLEGVDPLISLCQQARDCHKQGNYSQAVISYTKVLEEKVKLLGKRHPDVTYLLVETGKLLLERGQFYDSEKLLLTALSNQTTFSQKPSFELAVTYDFLATVFQKTGQHRKALEYMNAGVSILISLGFKPKSISSWGNPYERVADAFLLLCKNIAIPERVKYTSIWEAIEINGLEHLTCPSSE